MSYVVPNNRLVIFKDIPIERNYQHSLYFTNQTAQSNYFSNASRIKYTFNDMSHIRVTTPGNKIRVEININDLYDCNYLAITNRDTTSQKTFYCFIDNVEYVNENVSEISYSIDVLQTWMFEYSTAGVLHNMCFVEREHVRNDSIGVNLLPEPVQLGYYEIDAVDKIDYGDDSWYIVFQSTADVINGVVGALTTPPPQYVFGIMQTAEFLAYPCSAVLDSAVKSEIENLLAIVGIFSRSNAILSCYMSPYNLLPENAWIYNGTGYDHVSDGGRTLSLDSAFKTSHRITLTPGYDGFTPKNNKLLTHPYCFFTGTACEGESIQYKFEDFNDTSNIYFHVYTDGSAKPRAACIPMRYPAPNSTQLQLTFKEMGNALTLSSFPECTWATNDIGAKIIQGIIGTGITALSRGLVYNNSTNTINYADSTKQNTPDVKLTPLGKGIADTIGNVSFGSAIGTYNGNGSINYASKQFGFFFYRTHIRNELAQVIDNFFTMFGYSVNTLKYPSFHNRRYWTYLKTRGCTVSAGIPNDDADAICDIFDNGVTFWDVSSGATVGDYTPTNSTI